MRGIVIREKRHDKHCVFGRAWREAGQFNTEVFHRSLEGSIATTDVCRIAVYPADARWSTNSPYLLFCPCSTRAYCCSSTIRRLQYMSECLPAQNKIHQVVRIVKAQYHQHTCKSHNREQKLHPTEAVSTTWTRQVPERNPGVLRTKGELGADTTPTTITDWHRSLR